jgi:hypothetical protein
MNKPPSCKSLNGDANLEPIRSERTAFFARALRRCARGCLHQLQERVRAEIRRVGLPVDVIPNATPFTDEDLSDNAFAYASVQVLKVGEREDGWHTDGGASLLHAGLTIFGSRQLLVKAKKAASASLSGLGPSTRGTSAPWSIMWPMAQARQEATGRQNTRCKSRSCFGATYSVRCEPATKMHALGPMSCSAS